MSSKKEMLDELEMLDTLCKKRSHFWGNCCACDQKEILHSKIQRKIDEERKEIEDKCKHDIVPILRQHSHWEHAYNIGMHKEILGSIYTVLRCTKCTFEKE